MARRDGEWLNSYPGVRYALDRCTALRRRPAEVAVRPVIPTPRS
jgi:hypothetical protein